jgi:hypothetical protein
MRCRFAQDFAMPNREPPKVTSRSASFRARYDALEQRRADLMARLTALGARAQLHPGHGRARTLLNTKFRRATLVQRAAILEAADWLITLIDRSMMLL